jgi:hypothetical protein
MNVTDPTDPNKKLEVINMTLTLKSETVCKLFNSC